MSLVTREKHIVDKVPTKCRVYDYLPGKLEIISSRKGIKKALKRGQIYRNGKVIFESDYVYENDIIELKIDEQKTKPFLKSIAVLYEDDFLAVVDKPPGLVVSGNRWKTLEHALVNNLKKSVQDDYLPFPLAAHRIDAMTGGLVLIAKTYSTRKFLGELFENQEIDKEYYAVVHGEGENNFSESQNIEGKKAQTDFKTLKVVSYRDEKISLLNCSPISGRRHQIRIHLANNDLPIIADKKYGKNTLDLDRKALFLYSKKLSFNHPVSNEKIEVERKLPKRFRQLFGEF